MNANEINARRAANEFVNTPTHRVNTVDKYGNEMSCPAWGLDMAEAIAADRRTEFPNDTTEIVATGATEYANETIANTPANLAKLHTLATAGTPMYYIWLDAVDDAATTSIYLSEEAARADIARLEADDIEAGIYEPNAYSITNAAPYFV